jgi:hypothetical protein
LREEAVEIERCPSQKFVLTPRGTRKAGAVVEAAGKASAIYEVKHDECCVLPFGCLHIIFSRIKIGIKIMICIEIRVVPKTKNNERNTLLLCAFAICDNPV